MATFEKRGARWRVQVCVRGRRESATFTTKSMAASWALEREADPDEVRTTHTLGDALTRYLRDVTPTKRGAKYEERRIKSWLRDAKLCGYRLDEVTPDVIGQLRDKRLAQVAPGTVLRELVVMSAVFESARREWQWCRANPVRDVRKPPAPPHRERLISDAERDALTAALGLQGDAPTLLQHQVAIAFLIALETAMRAGEVITAKPDLKSRVARLGLTKNGSRRDVPLSTRAVELYNLLPGGFTVSSATLDVLFRKARDRAGLEDLTFHDSRHTAITRLADKLDVLELARMTGHKNPKSLMVYYNKPASEIAKRLG